MNPHIKRSTPGETVTSYAFKYSRSFFDFASKSLPELDQYPRDADRGPLLQAAIIVATLIMMERKSAGAGRNELHQDVVGRQRQTLLGDQLGLQMSDDAGVRPQE